jgi:hypothetical protein
MLTTKQRQELAKLIKPRKVELPLEGQEYIVLRKPLDKDADKEERGKNKRGSRLAEKIVKKNHYLHRSPANIIFAFGCKRPERSLVQGVFGVTTYTVPMWSLRVGVVGEKKADLKREDAMCHHVLELSRAWLSEHLPWNSESRFVSWCLREMKKTDPHLIVVSYADSAEGHYGYLYQSLNFIYTGTSVPWVDRTIEGKDHRSVSRERLKGPDVIRKTRSKKHRYVWFANKRDKKLLAWPEMPYPKAKPLA